jgi:hypothetical protein
LGACGWRVRAVGARLRCSGAPGVQATNWPWAVDGHKWLQTPYDCGYAIVRDAEAHRRAMTIAPSYLPSAAEGDRDPTHFVPELSRRARGFATWAMFRHLGREGIAALVQGHCRLAARFAERLVREPGVYVHPNGSWRPNVRSTFSATQAHCKLHGRAARRLPSHHFSRDSGLWLSSGGPAMIAAFWFEHPMRISSVLSERTAAFIISQPAARNAEGI